MVFKVPPTVPTIKIEFPVWHKDRPVNVTVPAAFR